MSLSKSSAFLMARRRKTTTRASVESGSARPPSLLVTVFDEFRQCIGLDCEVLNREESALFDG